jgi:hypothetical protein
VLLIKTSAFSWNNNCVIINMHGKTTLKIVMLPVILQACTTSSHSIREGHNMLTIFTVFERKVTIRIRPCGRKREGGRGERRELQS